MRSKLFWLKLALVVLMLAFIWGNSMLPGGMSSRESGFVLRLLNPFISTLQRFLEARGVLLDQSLIVRKLAHFTEYAVLGFLMLLLFLKPGLRCRPVISGVLCLAAAAADESIQIFAIGRGPSVRDTALDFSGAVVGIALAVLAVCVARALQRRKIK